MRVCVELLGLDDGFSKSIDSEIRKNWPKDVLVIDSDTDVPKGVQALLLVGERESSHSSEPFALVDRINTTRLNLNQILYEINARLGKMTSSDLISANPVSFVKSQSKDISRRDLFAGLKKGFTSYSDAPYVFADECETKYGCTKCVQICPLNALKSDLYSLTVNESVCNRCGLCSAVCPVGAIQLPRFSERAFLGLIDGLQKSGIVRKSLLFTCDASKVEPIPWLHVEEVADVGMIGTKHIALAATSGLGAVIVFCADGSCSGRSNAKEAVKKISNAYGENASIVYYLEGEKDRPAIKSIHEMSRARSESISHMYDVWENYVRALKSLCRQDAVVTELGLSELNVSDTCTLCEACVMSCPHRCLNVINGVLQFNTVSCTGCGYCARICPEYSITISSLGHMTEFRSKNVYVDEIINCERCGKPVGSARFLKRVSILLGNSDSMIMYCNNCKQAIAFNKLLGRNLSK
ncbi:MAG: 4Fe-4S binding protein [Nitrososphaerota archaeon]|nr:4Fe-4S binding protein [Nitrososphaerota archaeon]